MGWQQAEEAVAKAKGGKFIKLENDGDFVVIALPFCGPKPYPEHEPAVIEEIWDDKEEKNVPYTSVHKNAGKDPSSKFLFNAYVVRESGEKANNAPENCELGVYQCTTATCKEIFAARDKYGMDKLYEVKRFGAAKSKKTKYKVMYDSDISPEHKARIAELAKNKHDLLHLDEEDDTKQGSKPKTNGASAAGGATISDAIADELLPLLKAMPDDKRKGFLKEFGIARVRELKMSDVDRARAWIKGDAKPATKEDDAFI